MSNAYTIDRTWADSYEDQVISILNDHISQLVVLSVASEEMDKKCATDFIITILGGTVAVRLRRLSEFKDPTLRDLTLRSRRLDSKGQDVKTERAKIKEGHAFRYFYGWIDDNGKIIEWMLVDLDKVREKGLLERERRDIPNTDRVTWFIAISVRELYVTDCLIDYQGTEIERKLKSPQRHVNENASTDNGLKRAKKKKCYSPMVIQDSLFQVGSEYNHEFA